MEQLSALTRTDMPKGLVLADAGYGNNSEFRQGIHNLNLSFGLGIQETTKLWAPDTEPLPPPEYSGCGRPPKLPPRSLNETSVIVLKADQDLPNSAYQTIAWREGTNKILSNRFAAIRVHEGCRYYWHGDRPPEKGLPIEWPEREPEPAKYWLSNLGQPFHLKSWQRQQSFGGALNATTRNSNRESAWVILRAEAGGESTIMPPYVLPPTGSWLPSEVLFPPLAPTSGQTLRYLTYPKVGSRGDPSLRPERHSP